MSARGRQEAGERLGIIGGTFDPIHLGHLAAATAASDALDLDEVLFIPSHHPPHRPVQPTASAFHRFAMVSLALAADERFVASDWELQRHGPSFTADTLRALQDTGLAAWQLFFIIGTDAFAEIATWHDYPGVLDLAHFVVISRPGQSFDALRQRLPEWVPRMGDVATQAGRTSRSSEVPAGGTGGPSSTAIFLVPANTPDVSSTVIRGRAAARGSLDGLVPREVERHIRRHRLYASR